MAKSLVELIKEVFASKDYAILRSSEENRLIVAGREDEVLAIGYSEMDTPPTIGEVEMFSTISEGEGATVLLFISPAKLSRETLEFMKRSGIEVWDRTTLVLAIGECALKGAASFDAIEEWESAEEIEPAPDRFQVKGGEDLDPLAELRRFERTLIEEPQTKVKEVSYPPPSAGSPAKGIATVRIRSRPFPGASRDEDKADGVEKIVPAEPDESPPPPMEEETMAALPMMSEDVRAETPPPPDEKDEGTAIAPLRIGREEAVQMAPGTVKDLELVYRPFLLQEVCFSVRTVTGDTDDRTEHLMVDLVDGSVLQVPAMALHDLEPAREMEEGSRTEDPSAIDLEKARSSIREKVALGAFPLEKKVHDGIMSTIYKEMEALLVEGSYRVVTERQVSIPVWKGRLALGASVWLMDGYAGTQRRLR